MGWFREAPRKHRITFFPNDARKRKPIELEADHCFTGRVFQTWYLNKEPVLTVRWEDVLMVESWSE
jgi:hypothetical protein